METTIEWTDYTFNPWSSSASFSGSSMSYKPRSSGARPQITDETTGALTIEEEGMTRRRRLRRRRRPLGELFAELNQSYFGGRLPAYGCRRYGPRIGVAGEIRNRRLGTCDPQRRQIRVIGMLPLEEERRVLLHEMCHAAAALDSGHGHGPHWRNEMRRIAREHGEAWAETTEYAGIAPVRRNARTEDDG